MPNYKISKIGEVQDRETGKVFGTVRKDGKIWRAILPGRDNSIIRYNTRQGAANSLAHVR